MNPILMLVVGIVIGIVVGWLIRVSKTAAPDTRIESELRSQLDALRRDLEKSAGERLQAESARAAAEASKQAAEQQRQLAIDQAGALAVELKAANDKLAEVSSSLAAAEANEAATARQAGEQKKALEEQYRVMKEMSENALATVQQDLAAALAEAKGLRERMDTTTTALASTEASLKAANERNLELKRVHDEQYRTLKESHEKALADLRQAFSALSAEALKQAQPEFLRLANETLAKFNESAKGDLAQRQESIATLVKPLEEQLKIYQQRLAQSETTQAEKLGEVSKHLSTLTQQSMALSTETLQLRKVLSSSQARGRWGEETLRRVVEAAGMSAHCDFTEQAQSEDKKPDLIVRLPGERVIIVDAKVPDLDFLNALGAADEIKRAESLKAHAEKLRATIKALADRDYPSQFEKSLDHVVLFLPAESLFSAALEGDSDLIVWAAQRRILLATPASLIALLRSVSISWQQHEQTMNAKEIAEAASGLFSRVATFAKHFVTIGAGLERASSAYNDAVGSYDRSVRPSGERLLKLGTDAGGKTLPNSELLANQLRQAPVLE
jgi:DNA recombination protein RmuC